ncbi:MAG: ATP-binding protein [Rhodospirillaceae bacterium]
MQGWLAGSLSRRLMITVAAVLMTASAVFLVLFVGLYRAQLEAERSEASAHINRLLQASLENAMLKRDLDGLQAIITRLGELPSVAGVMLLDPTREIRFASDPALLGTSMPEEPLNEHTRFLTDAKGRPVLRSVNPVANKPQCVMCHGEIADNPINGVLFVDYDAEALTSKALGGALTLAASGLMVLILTLGLIYVLLRSLVVRPVEALVAASDALARGDLSVRVPTRGADEIGRLGATFNHMAANLELSVEALQRRDAYLQALIDGIPDGVRVLDRDFTIVAANRAYCDQLLVAPGSPVGKACYASSHHRERPCAATMVTCPLHLLGPESSAIKAVHQHVRADGSTFFTEITAARITVPGVDGSPRDLIVESIRDMSADIEVSHGQRMSEVAELATGVAHEVRNPLVAIRLTLEGIVRRGDVADPELARYLTIMRDEIERCLGVTERLLDLAHLPTTGPEAVPVAAALSDVQALLSYEARVTGVDLAVTPLPAGACVWMTGAELRMVAINMMQNALHAMPTGGTLTVSATVEDDRLVLRFADTGVGIPAETLGRIFDPYFSARADGAQGTGMGLAICTDIVESYGGTITVDSVVGEGTTFSVSMPLHKEEELVQPD